MRARIMALAWLAAGSVALLLSPAASSAQQERDLVSRSGLRYSLRMPKGKKSARGAPLVIMLHGTGGHRLIWNEWAEAAVKRGYLVALPLASGTGAGDPYSGNQGDGQRRWAMVDVPKVRDLALELLAEHGADRRHVSVFGMSNGGIFAHEVGLRNHDLFSAIVCIGGACNVYDLTPGSENIGVYFIHGTLDDWVAYGLAKKAYDRLRTLGFENVVLKTYPERGHELFPEEIKSVFKWLRSCRLRLRPGTVSTLEWDEAGSAALERPSPEVRFFVYFFAEKDHRSSTAEHFEWVLLESEEVLEAVRPLTCLRVNRDEAAELCKELRVRGPTLMLLDGNREKLLTVNRSLEPARFVRKLREALEEE